MIVVMIVIMIVVMLKRDQTYLTVERQDESTGDWKVVCTDSAWETRYVRKNNSPFLYANSSGFHNDMMASPMLCDWFPDSGGSRRRY